MAFVLASEIQSLAKDFGIERLGFLTLTFAAPITDLKEAQRRFKSLNSNVIRKRYARAIGCWERQRSGRIHFHLVVVLPNDIRTGFDFGGIARRDYRSASDSLRREWAFWRKTAPAYGFGRTELLPVRSSAEGIARYVGKYVSKHIGERRPEDKGARVVRFIGFQPGQRRYSTRFSWNTDNGWLWRQKLRSYCQRVGARDTEDLWRIFGPRWAYILQGEIMLEPVTGCSTVYPSEEMAMAHAAVNIKEQVMAKHQEQHPCAKTYYLKPPSTFQPSGVPATTHRVESCVTSVTSDFERPSVNGASTMACGSWIATYTRRCARKAQKARQEAFDDVLATWPVGPEGDPF